MSEVQASTETNTSSTDTSTQNASNTTQNTSDAGSGSVQEQIQAAAAKANGTVDPNMGAVTYTPNYKYKIKDKELEFDEYIRPVIKDADTEKKVKDLYERAFGLDEVKQSRDSFKTKFDEVSGKYGGLEKSLQTLSGFVQRKDFGSFFETLQIPKENVVKWVIDELRYNELPPEQKAQIDEQKRFQSQQYQFQTQSEQHMHQMREFTQQQLSFEMSKPDVANIVQNFDQRMGQGAFQREVINRGAYYEQVQGKSLPASQLVSEVLALVSPGGQQATPNVQDPNAVAQTTTSQGVTTQQEAKPAVKVFNSGGGSASPVKKTITSLDELRKLREERQQG